VRWNEEIGDETARKRMMMMIMHGIHPRSENIICFSARIVTLSNIYLYLIKKKSIY
jgi:hypothetical protein